MSLNRNAKLISGVCAVVAAIGCSRHEDKAPAYRTLATGVSLWRCAVDDDFVYGLQDAPDSNTIVRVSRRTGVVERLHDAHAVESMVAANHTLYWLDGEPDFSGKAIHAWKAGESTRVEVRKHPNLSWSENIVRFGERVCWGVYLDTKAWNEKQDETKVECLSLPTGQIATFTFPKRLGARVLAAGAGHLYVKLLASFGGTEVLDITDTVETGGTPKVIGSPQTLISSGFLGDLLATPAGPVLVENQSDKPDTLWVLAAELRKIKVPSATSFIHTVGDQLLAATPAGLMAVELSTGGARLVANVHSGTDASPGPSPFCGDASALFAEGPDASVIEIPIATTTGGDHGKAR